MHVVLRRLHYSDCRRGIDVFHCIALFLFLSLFLFLFLLLFLFLSRLAFFCVICSSAPHCTRSDHPFVSCAAALSVRIAFSTTRPHTFARTGGVVKTCGEDLWRRLVVKTCGAHMYSRRRRRDLDRGTCLVIKHPISGGINSRITAMLRMNVYHIARRRRKFSNAVDGHCGLGRDILRCTFFSFVRRIGCRVVNRLRRVFARRCAIAVQCSNDGCMCTRVHMRTRRCTRVHMRTRR